MTQALDPLFLSFQAALAGRYSIDRELGRGGMGIVYLAREVHLDRLVAIKLLPPDLAQHAWLRERFLREARLAAKLSHPNIIPIHAVEDTGGFVFYVMAFVDGETLGHRVRTRGPLATSDGARVLREVAWALAYAHAQSLVHRDVKPDNILLESATGRALVADFGIAAAANEELDAVSGTPEFMSPEQVLGGQIDARSDIYGLGATAFYAFSGRFPFEGRSATEILAKQVTEMPPPLASLGLTVPRKLASIIDRCLAKAPGDRPADAQVLAEQLGVALERRRELPAALRAFVKGTGRLDGGGTLITCAGLLAATVASASVFGGNAALPTLLVGYLVAPTVFLVSAARRLMLLGFDHTDIAPAFKAEIDQAQEVLVAEERLGSKTLRRWLPIVAGGSSVVFVTTAAMMAQRAAPGLFGALLTGYASTGVAFIWTMMLVSGATALASTISLITIRRRKRDFDTEFWSRVWTGPIGRFAFGVARKLLGDRTRQTVMTHRATELSLGMAAEQLYEGLPKEARRALGDLPALLRRLQDDAQSLRQRYDELQQALAEAGVTASSDDYAPLRATRDEIQANLREAVGALETIRLNLLRLHAGSVTVDGLTTDLGAAAVVSEAVERLIAAHDEVDRTLKLPREPAITPV